MALPIEGAAAPLDDFQTLVCINIPFHYERRTKVGESAEHMIKVRSGYRGTGRTPTLCSVVANGPGATTRKVKAMAAVSQKKVKLEASSAFMMSGERNPAQSAIAVNDLRPGRYVVSMEHDTMGSGAAVHPKMKEVIIHDATAYLTEDRRWNHTLRVSEPIEMIVGDIQTQANFNQLYVFLVDQDTYTDNVGAVEVSFNRVSE
jgi:hypothetical protein